MKLTSRIMISLALLLVGGHTALAATNPVAWQISGTLQNPVFSGRTYTLTYTLTSHLPFTMVKALAISKTATPANEFSYTDNCSGLRLSPGQSCTVTVTFLPVAQGNKSLLLVAGGFDNSRTPAPLQTTTAQGSNASGSVYGLATQSLGSSSNPGVAQGYTFTFTNPTSSAVSNVSVQVTQTAGTPSYTTTCSSSLAGENGQCTVTGSYTPTSTASHVQTVTATLKYGSGKSATASTSTNVVSTTGVVGSFVGNNYLPAVMVGGGTDSTLWFLFTNNGPGSVVISSQSTSVTTGSSVGSITETFDHCTGVSLGVGAACDIKYSFHATTVVSPTEVTVESTVNYTGGTGSSAALSTSTTVVSALSSSRTITFVNNCNFPVWFSLNGGQLLNSPSCTTDSDCPSPTATACSPITKKCFWKNQPPNTHRTGGVSDYKLDAAGGSVTQNTVTIPLTGADPTIQWSGNISASLGCTPGVSCAQADCSSSGGNSSCEAGQGFSPPATQAEITMSQSTNDSYDVEVINGFHVPISMAPTQYVTANNYNCGNPGNYTAENGFGSCNWATATPPGNGYYLVTSGVSDCNISAPHCTDSSLICGLDANLQQKCGQFQGYWTADQVCGMSSLTPAISSYFKCNTKLSSLSSSVSFPSGAVLYDLMACAVPTGDLQPTYNSCYLTYSGVPASNQLPCCGCIDWWTVSGIGSNSNTQSCTQAGKSSPQTDPVWNQYIQAGVQWLKKACPSAYVYPFDDKTSGFSCTNTLPGSPNSTDYTITFCQGNTGLPSGYTNSTEGRG